MSYISPGQQGPHPYPNQMMHQAQQQQQQMQYQQGLQGRSQSSRDIIRQEAKLQEMQEEVRRRELRSGPNPPIQMPGAYRATNTYNPRLPGGGLPQRPPPRPLGSTPNLGPSSPGYLRQNYGYLPDQHQQYGQHYPRPSPQQQYAVRQNGPYMNGPEADQYGHVLVGRSQIDGDLMNDNPPARPALPNSSGSPPPPLPNTHTHPLYQKQMDPSPR